MRLGEALHIKHGYAFKGQFFSEVGTHIVLTPGNFNEEGGFRLRPGKDRYYSGDIPEDFILKKGDLIIAMTEQGPGLLGSSAIIPEDGQYLHNQRLGLVNQLEESLLEKRFLYYLFNTKPVRGQISGSASGTKVRHTAPERVYRVKVCVPDVLAQGKIASILSAYDDLIENNRRRMQLLEQVAQLFYKEWFVHLRFPGHEHFKITNGLPDGWEEKKIEDVCETIGGGTPSTSNPGYWEAGDVTWVIPSDVTRNDCLALLDSEKKITESGLKSSSARKVPPETILMTSRASVGFFAMMDKEVCTNQGFINIVPHKAWLRMCLLHNLMYRVEEIRSHAGGATYKEISKGRFRQMAIMVASKPVAQEFDDLTYRILQQVRVLKKQQLTLIEARDLLLPRLMNGEIAV
ncbi:MAG: restriction endonuclease subunit S [Desulfobaccales bacterium]